ncbi:MAG: hypothetical protein JWP57_4377 [Spirosoma sp.]|nr:hypothetical protein [Spirosoma sp.]
MRDEQIPPDVRERLARTAARDAAFWESVFAGRKRNTLDAALHDEEAAMRKKHGDAAVDAQLATYKQLVAVSPELGRWVLTQEKPWQWVVETLPQLTQARRD